MNKVKERKVNNVTKILQASQKTNHKGRRGKQLAGHNGQHYEAIIAYCVGNHGFEIANNTKEAEVFALKRQNHITKNIAYQTMSNKLAGKHNVAYKTRKGRTEYLITAYDVKKPLPFRLDVNGVLKVRVECKWQMVNGTTKEKNMQAIFNLRAGKEELNAIFLVDGEAFTDEDIGWYEYCCRSKGLGEMINEAYHEIGQNPPQGKVVKKMNTNDFMDWINKTF